MIYTYFIQSVNGGPVKIGRAANPAQRLCELQTGSAEELGIVAVLEGDREAEMHARFARLRVRGEWFKNDEALTAFMRDALGACPLGACLSPLQSNNEPSLYAAQPLILRSLARRFDGELEMVPRDADDAHRAWCRAIGRCAPVYDNPEDPPTDEEAEEHYQLSERDGCDCDECLTESAASLLVEVNCVARIVASDGLLVGVITMPQHPFHRDAVFESLNAAARDLDYMGVGLGIVALRGGDVDIVDLYPSTGDYSITPASELHRQEINAAATQPADPAVVSEGQGPGAPGARPGPGEQPGMDVDR